MVLFIGFWEEEKMRFEQLEYFLSVVDEKSINKAANKLFISQSTISDALNKLEEEIGAKLLQRSHLGVTTTPEGKLFYETATDILEKLNKYKDTISSASDSQNMAFKLFITPEMLDSVVPEFMEYLSYNNPKLKLACRVGDFIDGIQAVIDDNVDLSLILIHQAILNHPEIQQLIEKNNLVIEEITQTKVMITVSRKSSLAKKETVSIYEILQYPVVFYKTDLSTLWHERAFESYGKLNIEFVGGNWELCDRYTSLHDNVYGFTSKSSSLRFRENKQVKLKEDIFYSTILVYRDKLYIDEKIKTVLRSLCNKHLSD